MHLPSLKNGLLVGGSLIALAVGASPLLVAASDHLDAPALGGVVQGGVIDPFSLHGDRDIADLYAFQGHDSSRTALVLTTNPAINLFGGHFGTNVRYIINVDRNGDAVQDLAYVFRFGSVSGGAQSYWVTRYTGSNARTLNTGVVIARGSTAGNGSAWGIGSSHVFAGVRSDPFFFDLLGFEGSVFGIGSARLGVDPSDFFANLNINAMVIEVPSDQLADNGTKIGIWGQTTYLSGGAWWRADQVGRPAINTVFNNSLIDNTAGPDKNLFNMTPPSQQRTADGGKFRTNIIATLTNIDAALGAVPPCSDWDATTAAAIANFLLPDVLTYRVGTTADGTTFNGRALADDVIDAELSVTTHGCVTSDGVGPHSDYTPTSFPYLGAPH